MDLSDNELTRLIDDRLPSADTYANHIAFRDLEYKPFHYMLCAFCWLSPTILSAAFVYSTHSNGLTLATSTISSGIAHDESNEQLYITTLVLTIVACVLAVVVTISRQIQIRVYFTEHSVPNGKCYSRLNDVAGVFNIAAYTFMVLTVAFDARRFESFHDVSANIGFTSAMVFLFFTSIITGKQRKDEYDFYLIRFDGDKRKAFKSAFYFIDAIIISILQWTAVVLLLVYVGEFLYQKSQLPPDENAKFFVRPYGNISEWICLFCLLFGLAALSLSFHHDNADDEILRFFKGCGRGKKESTKEQSSIQPV